MAEPVFDLEAFRLTFPQFAAVSDEVVIAASVSGLCFVSLDGCDCDQAMWQLIVSHLLQLQANAATGTGGGPVVSATIDKVSVSFAAPPAGTSAFKFWLYGTPYGAQLLALLARCSAGGVYVGGLPERAAFRSVGGIFPGRGRR